MKTFRIIILCSFWFLLAPIASRAESWRGIVPLRSTQADVETLLGKPDEATDELSTYRFPTETVFVFLIHKNTQSTNPGLLRPGTVEQIQVMPRRAVYLADLGLDEKNILFVKGSRPEYTGFQGYVDETAGLIVKTNGRLIEIIFYFANAKDRAACPSCKVNVKNLADVPLCELCPTVTVACPDETDAQGKATFYVNVTVGSPPPKLTLNWTVDAGIIVKGQGTESITVDTSQAKGNSITATVTVDGIDPACNRTASCTTEIRKRTRP